MTSQPEEEESSYVHFLDKLVVELGIIAKNATRVFVFTLALEIIGWEDSILKLFMYILVSCLVLYRYDMKTWDLPCIDLLIRFLVAVSLNYLSSYLKTQLMDLDFLRSDNISQYNNPMDRVLLMVISITGHYLESWRFMSLVRSYIVGIFLCLVLVPLISTAVVSIFSKLASRSVQASTEE